VRVNQLFCLIVSVLVVSCGDEGPTAPEEQEVRIRLSVDWPLVRERGLTNASWKVVKMMPPSEQDVVIGEGKFGSGGTAYIAYTTTCRAGGSTHHYVVYGAGGWHGPDRDGMGCGWIPHECTREQQTVTLDEGRC